MQKGRASELSLVLKYSFLSFFGTLDQTIHHGVRTLLWCPLMGNAFNNKTDVVGLAGLWRTVHTSRNVLSWLTSDGRSP